MATGNYGLAIVDAETAKSPLIFSQLQLNGTATDVSVDNGLGLAAVATGSGGLQIVNITDPRNPRLVTTILTQSTQVEVFEGIAYTNNGASLVSVDMATGDILQSIKGNAPITGIARDGQFIYTISSDNTFQIIDLNSGLMVLDATLSLPGGGQQLVVGDGVADVAAGKLLPDNSGTGGYLTVDVTNSHARHLIEGVDNFECVRR